MKLHNEVVQDVTRLYYTAVSARQQQQLAEFVILQLNSLVEIGERLLKEVKDPKELEGFNALKLQIMKDGFVKGEGAVHHGYIRPAIAALRAAGSDGRR